jgi:hypothetical protein
LKFEGSTVSIPVRRLLPGSTQEQDWVVNSQSSVSTCLENWNSELALCRFRWTID